MRKDKQRRRMSGSKSNRVRAERLNKQSLRPRHAQCFRARAANSKNACARAFPVSPTHRQQNAPPPLTAHAKAPKQWKPQTGLQDKSGNCNDLIVAGKAGLERGQPDGGPLHDHGCIPYARQRHF